MRLVQEKFYGRRITIADRFFVENDAEKIFSTGAVDDVALLVAGDPLW